MFSRRGGGIFWLVDGVGGDIAVRGCAVGV